MKMEELRRVCEAATPGPWTIDPRHTKYWPSETRDQTVGRKPRVTTDMVLEDRAGDHDALGAEVVGPPEPMRGTFTTWDAWFIATFNPLLVAKLLRIASAADSLLSEDDALEAVSQWSAAFILKDALAALGEP